MAFLACTLCGGCQTIQSGVEEMNESLGDAADDLEDDIAEEFEGINE